jgi:predicted transcriptional regulator
MSQTPTNDLKSPAHQLIDALPEEATWDDVMYMVYVRQCVESGLKDAEAGRVVSIDEVRSRFGLQT